jgi:type VI protein secretion system component VasF
LDVIPAQAGIHLDLQLRKQNGFPPFDKLRTGLRGNDGRKTAVSNDMTHSPANIDLDQRRAGIRRTVWIVAGVAVAVLVLFFLKQAIWH